MLNRRGIIVLFCIALLTAAFASSARADNETFGGENVGSVVYSGGPRGMASRIAHPVQKRNAAQAYAARFSDGIGPKPRKWCGWWMQHRTGVTSAATGLNLNRAIEWARAGSPGSGSSGDILVERSHVSQITGPGSRVGCYMTISGNVRNRVAPLERCRWVALRRV